jgi:RNA polymerase sigma-70 factor, ECF subfamily
MLHRFRKTPISSPAAFSELYERARLPVYRYIYGLTGGPQEIVEDLVAETFIRAWKSRQRFDVQADGATGWLIRIAKRLVIDDYRRRTVRTSLSLAADPAPQSLPEQSAIAAEQRQTLLVLLKELPDEQRELLTLRYMLGWRIGEIADHLGMTENNVSVTIHRLLARLREQWPDPEPTLEKIS